MQILHVYKSYYPETCGGVEAFIRSLVTNSVHYAVKHTLVTTHRLKKRSHYFSDNLEVYAYPHTINIASCPISYDLAKNFASHAKKADVIHYHYPWPFGDFLQVISSQQKPSIVTYHADIVRQQLLKIPYYPLMIRFLTKAKKIITTSSNYLESSHVLQKFKDKCTPIPIGLNEKHYQQNDSDRLDCWRNQLPADFVLFVGVLRYYKGLHFLLEAASNTQATIVIAGTGPEEKFLHRKAQTLGLTNVIFLGFVSDEDKIALYQLCKIVIAPSHLRSEAFCISLLEGLFFAKPLISTQLNTGTSFVNLHDTSGLVVPPANPAALANAINKLYQDQALYHRLSCGAAQHYQRHFRGEQMVTEYLKQYYACLNI